jgi:hypothetical protein
VRKVRAVVFLVAGILLGLVFVDEFFFHVTHGDATQYEYMALSAAGSLACFSAALADWRPVRQADSGDGRLREVRKARAMGFFVVGTLLALVAAFGRNSAPSAAYELGLAFPVVFGLAAVACFRSALSDWTSPPRHPATRRGLTPGR